MNTPYIIQFQNRSALTTHRENCRRRGFDPYAHLKDVLTRLPNLTCWQLPEVTHPQPGRKRGLQRRRGQTASGGKRMDYEKVLMNSSDGFKKFAVSNKARRCANGADKRGGVSAFAGRLRRDEEGFFTRKAVRTRVIHRGLFCRVGPVRIEAVIRLRQATAQRGNREQTCKLQRRQNGARMRHDKPPC